MSQTTPANQSSSPRQRLSVVVAGLLLAFFLLAFGIMGWIRSRQTDETRFYPSEIAALAGIPKPHNPLVDSQQRGREVYSHYCAICHGDEGNGNGFNSAQLELPPRNFTDQKFWKQVTDERLSLTVSQGGPAVGKSNLMPAWGKTLTDQQIQDVIAWLHTFAGQPNQELE